MRARVPAFVWRRTPNPLLRCPAGVRRAAAERTAPGAPVACRTAICSARARARPSRSARYGGGHTTVLHTGQQSATRSQLSTQSGWKMWPDGRREKDTERDEKKLVSESKGTTRILLGRNMHGSLQNHAQTMSASIQNAGFVSPPSSFNQAHHRAAASRPGGPQTRRSTRHTARPRQRRPRRCAAGQRMLGPGQDPLLVQRTTRCR